MLEAHKVDGQRVDSQKVEIQRADMLIGRLGYLGQYRKTKNHCLGTPSVYGRFLTKLTRVPRYLGNETPTKPRELS